MTERPDSIPAGARYMLIRSPDRPPELMWHKRGQIGICTLAVIEGRPTEMTWNLPNAAAYYNLMKASQESVHGTDPQTR